MAKRMRHFKMQGWKKKKKWMIELVDEHASGECACGWMEE